VGPGVPMKQTDFLARRRFAVGEFEAQQALFDRSIVQLSRALAEPVGRALSAQQKQDVATPYLAASRQMLDSLLGRASPAEEVGEAASMSLARRLRAELDSAPDLDDTEIEREVQSCSRELAERVLARWFDRLHRALRGNPSCMLSANLLPGTLSMEEMLEGIDFESHGVAKLMVVNGLRTYWDELTRASLETRQPIELGLRTWIVPCPGRVDQPFTLFQEQGAALEALKPALVPSTPPAAPRSEERYLRLYELVRRVLRPGAPVWHELALGVYRLSQADKRSNGLVRWEDGRIESALFSDGLMVEERQLMASVETGVDLVVAGLAAGDEQVGLLLHSDRYGIPQHLAAYAGLRGLPLDAVQDAFALAVSVGVEYQPTRLRVAAAGLHEPGFDAHRRFAETHGVTQNAAVRLVSTSFAGTALATPGMALP
jgi:hypothetical protein